ncbi:MAG TPA: hypothetical protein VF384_06080 [Planctomycetota bacterium]
MNDKNKKKGRKKGGKKGKAKGSSRKGKSQALKRRKWSMVAAAMAASVEVEVKAKCSSHTGTPQPPTGAALIAFYDDYKDALDAAVADVGWPIADSNAKPDKEAAIAWYHADEVVPRMSSSSTFRFAGNGYNSRQSPNGWVNDPNLAGEHWAVYDSSGGFVRYFGLDESS